ncbi:MAG: GntR family transcriptional regulator [Phycisphaerae bacterium]|nr:GntR family transcriptional regulator [Phycisphaerae bacterium]
MDSQAEREGRKEEDGPLSYKFQRLRERIRRAIDSGELSGKLPGERALARRFQVNAKTINKALSDLTTEGVVVRHIGRGTFVVASEDEPAPSLRAKRFAWVTLFDRSRAFQQARFECARRVAAAQGHELVFHCVQADLDGRMPEQALSPAELREIDGVAIVGARPTRALLADLLRRHMHLVLVNIQSDHVQANCVVGDYAAGTFHLCEHLIALGHRDVQLLVDSALMPCGAVAELGYLAAMRRHGLSPRRAVSANPVSADPSFFGGRGAPRALLCVGAAMAQAARQEASRTERHIPRDLSLAVVTGSGETMADRLGLTSYDIDDSKVIGWALELLNRNPADRRPQMIVVPGSVVDRGSCGPPTAPTGPTMFTEGII